MPLSELVDCRFGGSVLVLKKKANQRRDFAFLARAMAFLREESALHRRRAKSIEVK
jgi:hypothetical protein